MKSAESHRATVRQFIRFALVGCSNFLVSYCVYLLIYAANLHDEFRASIASFIGYAAGIAWSYMLNRAWTFQSRAKRLGEAMRFIAVQLVMLAASTVAIWLLVDRLGVNEHIGWIAVMGAVTILNFAFMKLYVFRNRSA